MQEKRVYSLSDALELCWAVIEKTGGLIAFNVAH